MNKSICSRKLFFTFNFYPGIFLYCFIFLVNWVWFIRGSIFSRRKNERRNNNDMSFNIGALFTSYLQFCREVFGIQFYSGRILSNESHWTGFYSIPKSIEYQIKRKTSVAKNDTILKKMSNSTKYFECERRPPILVYHNKYSVQRNSCSSFFLVISRPLC